jgi:hypothetical protein
MEGKRRSGTPRKRWILDIEDLKRMQDGRRRYGKERNWDQF